MLPENSLFRVVVLPVVFSLQPDVFFGSLLLDRKLNNWAGKLIPIISRRERKEAFVVLLINIHPVMIRSFDKQYPTSILIDQTQPQTT